jgi:hypothetical protein
VLKKGTILKRSKAGTFGERYAVSQRAPQSHTTHTEAAPTNGEKAAAAHNTSKSTPCLRVVPLALVDLPWLPCAC